MLKSQRFGEVTRFDLARNMLGRGRYWTTCYLVDGLLIDSGCAHSAQELAEALQDKPIRGILNTHSHEDHVGANGPQQRRRPGLEILAHPLALPALANPHLHQRLHLYQRIFWGLPQPCQGCPVKDGELIHTERHVFRVIYTPGHSADHLCLFEEERGWLFSGDLFVGGQERALRQDSHIWRIIASLKQLAALPITTLFPGSARVRPDPLDELQTKIAYLEEMGEKVLSLRRQGKSPTWIARRLFGKPMWVDLVTLGHFSRLRLVESYMKAQPE